jgi:hypothetical protein
MSRLFLSFTGALVFVSRHEVESRPNRNEMRVLFAETRMSPSESHGSHEKDEVHLPRLICPADSVVSGPDTRSADEPFKYKNAGQDLAMFYLDDQDLFLLKEREALSVNVGAVSDCPTQDNVCSYSWVVPLSIVDPGSEFVKPECFARLNPDPSVVARVALTEGFVHTHEVASDPGKGVIRWVFRPVDDNTKPEPAEQEQGRAIADSVMYEADFEGEVIELRTRLFRPAIQRSIQEIYPEGVGSERRIRLRASGGAVHVFVKNMALPDILGMRELTVRGADVHFAHVYRMSRQASRGNVPHPVGHCDLSRPEICETSPFPPDKAVRLLPQALRGHNGNPNCPPPKAAAFSDSSAWKFELPQSGSSIGIADKQGRDPA